MPPSDSSAPEWTHAQRAQLLATGLSRLPHALLLVGPAGIGKRAFAQSLCALLLCESQTPGLTAACGECQGCRWLQAGNHPDFRHVGPGGDESAAEEGSASKSTEAAEPVEKAKKRSPGMIRIDQIRDLEEFVFVGSHRHGRRVVLISEAESMNSAAANAVLKILEEPPSGVHFILVSSRPQTLLPTIRSRCRQLVFDYPEKAVAVQWLARAGLDGSAARYLDLAAGAPLRVAQWKEEGYLATADAVITSLRTPPNDPLALAARWDGLLKGDGAFRLEHLLETLQRWLFDLVQERMAGEVRYHSGWPRPAAVHSLNPQALLTFWRELQPFRRSARHPLNQLLVLENIATLYLRALRPQPS